nr:Cys-motif [Cotesia vestalis bracovirus]
MLSIELSVFGNDVYDGAIIYTILAESKSENWNMMTVSGMPRYIIKSLSVNKPTVPVICLPLGTLCVKSKLPCCILSYQDSYLRLGKVPTTCFEFGKGICQINSSIENFEEYGKLIKQRNDTNFEELRTKYWNSTQSAYICPQKITLEMKKV